MPRNRKQPWLFITGVCLTCFGVRLMTAPRGIGYLTFSFIGAAALIVPACVVIANRSGRTRRYLPFSYVALWMGVFMMFADLPVLAGNAATLFFLCLASSCLTLHTQRGFKYAGWLRILAAAFAFMGLLCFNRLWLLSLIAANIHILLAIGLIAAAVAVFYRSAKSK